MRQHLLKSLSLRAKRVDSFGSISSSQSTGIHEKQGSQNATFPTIEDTLGGPTSSGAADTPKTMKRTGSMPSLWAAACFNRNTNISDVTTEREQTKTAQKEQEKASTETVAQRAASKKEKLKDPASKKEKFNKVPLETSPPLQVQVGFKTQNDSSTSQSPASHQSSSSLKQLHRSTSLKGKGTKWSQCDSSGTTEGLVNSRRSAAVSTSDLLDEYDRIFAFDETNSNDVVEKDNTEVVSSDFGMFDLESSFNDSSSLQASSTVLVGNDLFSRYEEIISEHDEYGDDYNEGTREHWAFGQDSLSSISIADGLGVYRPSPGFVKHDSRSNCVAGVGRRASLRGFKHSSCSSFGGGRRGSLDGGSRSVDPCLTKIPECVPRHSRRSSII